MKYLITPILLLIPFGYACSCIQPPPPLTELESVDHVFAGKVIDIDEKRGLITSSADPVTVQFEVFATWKGSENTEIILTTARDSASCGFSFKEQEEYLVYAGDLNDGINASLCSRTNLLVNAQEDLDALGPGYVPAVPGPTKQPMSMLIWIIIVAAILVGAIIFTIRRK